MAKLSLNNVTLAQEIDGVAHIDSATSFPAGHVIQHKSYSFSGQATLTGGSTATLFTFNFTPKRNDTIIYFDWIIPISNPSAGHCQCAFEMYRNNTSTVVDNNLSRDRTGGSNFYDNFRVQDASSFFNPIRFSDEPNTINMIEYIVQGTAGAAGYNTVYIHYLDRTQTSLYVKEVIQ